MLQTTLNEFNLNLCQFHTDSCNILTVWLAASGAAKRPTSHHRESNLKAILRSDNALEAHEQHLSPIPL